MVLIPASLVLFCCGITDLMFGGFTFFLLHALGICVEFTVEHLSML